MSGGGDSALAPSLCPRSDGQRGRLRALFRRGACGAGHRQHAARPRRGRAGRRLQLRREPAGLQRRRRHRHRLAAAARLTYPAPHTSSSHVCVCVCVSPNPCCCCVSPPAPAWHGPPAAFQQTCLHPAPVRLRRDTCDRLRPRTCIRCDPGPGGSPPGPPPPVQSWSPCGCSPRPLGPLGKRGNVG